ncbi:hypothetical protein GCM10010219_33530 [Streptomyces netropsis]|nr:hypothetical protein GCM10010219_33530 [Streptomyces netropsis]
MTAPARPPLKSPTPPTDHPSPAKQSSAPDGSGAPKVAARQGALSALRPDPLTVTVTGIRPGLHVRDMLERVPIADWLCACGHHERARGRAAVADLAARARVGDCPHRLATTTAPHRRAAA